MRTKMLPLVTLVFWIGLVLGSCGPQQTMLNEGKKLCCYYDSKNIPTIGIGYNLRRADASKVMSQFGLNISTVLKDCQKKTKKSCLTNEQVTQIFNTISYPEAVACVDHFVPALPTLKRAAIIDVAFAGCKTLNDFNQMRTALQKSDWRKAGEELQNSQWCKQVKKTRCNSDYNCLIGSKLNIKSIALHLYLHISILLTRSMWISQR